MKLIKSRNAREGRYAGKYNSRHFRTFQLVGPQFYVPWCYLAYSESIERKVAIQSFKIKLFD